jgi:hypothetical protein
MKAMEPDRIHDVSHEIGFSPDASMEPEAMVSRRVMRNARPGGERVEAAEGGSGFADAINVGLVQRAAEGSGQSLPGDLRGKFEQSLGTDLGGVRVHTHSAAAEASQSLGARAYAVGQDVFMGAGEYNPSSPDGASLLAHEVAHTVQQRGAAAGPQTKLEVSSPGDAHEADADRAADAMVRGEKTSVMTSTGIARKIQRDLHGRHGHGHGHGAAVPTTTTASTTTGAAPTTAAPTTAAPTAAAPAHTAQELEDILNFIPLTWQNICDAQILAVQQLASEINTPNTPSMAETVIAGIVNAAVGAAVGQIATFIASIAGPAVQRLITGAVPAATGAATATTTPAPAAGASGAATTTAGAATTTTGGAIATWVTDKIKDRIKSDLEVSASTLAGNVAGQTPSQQFVNAQQEALLNAKNSAQLEFNTHMGRFRTSPHGYEEARGLRDSNAEAARTRANPAQHAASLAEWARTGQGRSAGVLEIIDEINHRNFGETSLVVNVDMPEPNSDVHVQSARWPALNDATRQALRSRHASMRIEEFNPAMRIRIYTQRWRPFIGESYFDLTKIPGQSNVEFEHTGTPLLFLFQRQNPGGSPSTTPVDVQQSAAQVAAQMIWLGIWHSQIGRLGEISG